MYGPPKPRSKVVPPSNKRKVRPDDSSDADEDDIQNISLVKRSKSKKKDVLVEEVLSDYDVEKVVQEISPIKNSASKKLSIRVPDAPLDNISFHSVGNAEKWKYVFQRRIALEREFRASTLECK